ncbi:MAG: ribonuclease H-like domain-containing protein [Desulfofustis sp.]|nr:ribonuclease H-like domain-containing protein [Desulfofustis sp.]MBT8354014.1 ribonuclease H-like domain-containing protein [Desulfofustis sp.]NNF46968.1 ribonuclease H-like domain-containing protein [Desulfofustis sp.]NNK14051.1 ribonuclease H-like domain-containing protein [Desulfofustis sp.]NNK57188.1 ribonuclease H-like domain-containing protein [Desulfofustis sp.]
MLEHTFCHIQGIGHGGERRLWQDGICCWNDLLDKPDIVPRVSEHEIVAMLEQSTAALGQDDPSFFSSHLKQGDSWRLFPHFREHAGYLDIETTGLGPACEITTIALYDGDRVHTYVNGINLDDFVNDIDQIKLFISFNGISFDIPIIESYFRIQLDQPHIDLRYVLSRLGIKGGLKRCEKQLGLNRGSLDGVDGSFAVLLWREYQRYGNEQALETLLAYNLEDAVNLERLLVEAYNRNLEKTPFYDDLQIAWPVPPMLTHQPNLEIVEAIRRQNQGFNSLF